MPYQISRLVIAIVTRAVWFGCIRRYTEDQEEQIQSCLVTRFMTQWVSQISRQGWGAYCAVPGQLVNHVRLRPYLDLNMKMNPRCKFIRKWQTKP